MNIFDNTTVFDWDKFKENKILKKHNINKKEAEDVFKDDKNLYSSAKEVNKEQRFSVMENSSNQKRLIVFFMIRKNMIRVISARPQSRKERKIYNEIFKK